MLDTKPLIEAIYSQENLERLNSDYLRYKIYNGKLKEVIRTAIQKEFLLPETVREMSDRIIPINITQKIVNKLAAVYREKPLREAADYNEKDQENIDALEGILGIDHKMKQANRYFKLHKHVAIEPYLSSEFEPELRVLPSHTYTPYSDDPIEPYKPNVFIKHLSFTNDPEKDRHVVWSKDFHFVMNGKGNIIFDENNPEALNPYGEIPIIYVKDSDDQLIPIQDDDLVSMQVAICLLLTDLAFATKYASWSVLYIIGADGAKLSFNPNSVISLPMSPDGTKPEIGTIKPTLDTDSMLRQVETLLGLLLTTKSLSVNGALPGMSANQASSGVAKILDNAESTEDRTDQIAFFEKAEHELWELMAHKMFPVWNSQIIEPEYKFVFSEAFELSISFPELKISISESEQVDIQVKKLDNKLTSHEMAISALNPELTQEQVKQVILDIKKESEMIMDIQQQQQEPQQQQDNEEELFV